MENRLKLLRKVTGKTQKEVASVVGVTQNAYSYWERGRVKIHMESLKKLSEYYGVTVDFIIGMPIIIKTPKWKWSDEARAQYEAADSYTKEYLRFKYGSRDESEDSAEEKSDCLEKNTVMYNHDGKDMKATLTPAQMKIFYAMLNLEYGEDGNDV